MDQWLVISLRVIHIMTGAAWVGSAFLLMGFFIPTARRLGAVEGTLYLNRFLDHPWFSRYISSVEGTTVLTGLVLFWNASGGLQSAWLTSPTGIAFSLGGAAAIIALGISIPISATLSKLYYLGEEIASRQDSGHERDSAFNDYHSRLARLGAVYVPLLALALAAMASAQYLT